jgi:hypothetical protein
MPASKKQEIRPTISSLNRRRRTVELDQERSKRYEERRKTVLTYRVIVARRVAAVKARRCGGTA